MYTSDDVIRAYVTCLLRAWNADAD